LLTRYSIGIVFQFQNKLRKLFAWRYPTQTWAFLFVYSFVCLDPYLLLVLPLVVLLFFIMIPAFLARHPAPPPTASTSSTTPYYSYEGPALAPAKTIKPVPETSKDFFRNMRDLQNSMADFASAHDVVASSVSPLANFSDEIMSSTVFLFLTAIGASLFITAHWLPWRLIFMMSGNVAVISGHPTVTAFLKHSQQLLAGKGSDAIGKPSESSGAITVLGYALPNSLSGLLDLLTSLAAVRLDSAPEEREVEIFELQHKVYSPYSATPEWEPFVFTPTPYDPLSPSRVAGDRPRGTRFFEDVSPPPGWAWKSKKWELDLDCAEWVMERMVTGVEFEVPGGGAGGGAVGGGASSGAAADGIGEEVGGWVWDLPFRPPDVGLVDEAGDVPLEGLLDGACNSKTKTEGLAGSQSTNADWEEATRRTDRVGEWRRRRWVRVVKRVRIDR
jgi:hypothetical protein